MVLLLRPGAGLAQDGSKYCLPSTYEGWVSGDRLVFQINFIHNPNSKKTVVLMCNSQIKQGVNPANPQ